MNITCNLYYSYGAFFFFFKQKTAYEIRISDWSSDVCSSDLDHWNAEVLALSAPGSAQFLDSALTLARFDKPQPTIEERAKVHFASLETSETTKAPEAKVITASYAPAATSPLAEKEPQSHVRRARLVVTGGQRAPTFRRAGPPDQ